MDKRFNIDFFEFCLLSEACIPPRPIARAMFWISLIDHYYYILKQEERDKLYEWINKNPCMEDGIEKGNEDCLLFNARYNPNNQYTITTKYKGKVKKVNAFKLDQRYYTSSNTSIVEDYITDIKHG